MGIKPFGALALTQEYIRRTQGKSEPVFDVNDMEDGYICLHLNLIEPRILVTGDKGTREAVNHAMAQLTTASATLGAPVIAHTRAISIPDFLATVKQ